MISRQPVTACHGQDLGKSPISEAGHQSMNKDLYVSSINNSHPVMSDLRATKASVPCTTPNYIPRNKYPFEIDNTWVLARQGT